MTKIRLIQLMDAKGGPADGAHAELRGDDRRPTGLKAVAAYAYGIGPNKSMLWTATRRRPRWSPTRMPPGCASTPGPSARRITFCPTRFRRGTDPAAHGDVADGDRRRPCDSASTVSSPTFRYTGLKRARPVRAQE